MKGRERGKRDCELKVRWAMHASEGNDNKSEGSQLEHVGFSEGQGRGVARKKLGKARTERKKRG